MTILQGVVLRRQWQIWRWQAWYHKLLREHRRHRFSSTRMGNVAEKASFWQRFMLRNINKSIHAELGLMP